MSWLALYGVFVTFGIGIYIFGIFLAKNRGFFVTNSELILKRAVSMLKSTPAGKTKFATAGCDGCGSKVTNFSKMQLLNGDRPIVNFFVSEL